MSNGHVSKVLRWAGYGLGLAFALAPLARAQQQQAPDEMTSKALRELSAQASVVFAGQVLSVVHRSLAGAPEDARGLVEVTFRVEAAVRGCADDETYVLREWAGLWIGRSPRYAAGERLLMLLAKPRDGRGLAAPVGGDDGAIRLYASSAPALRDRHGDVPRDSTAFYADDAAARRARLLASLQPDLRWVRARAEKASNATVQPGLGPVLHVLEQTGANDAAH